MRKSIVFPMNKCCVCGKSINVRSHEIFFGTANRKKSIEDGMVAPLCDKDHNTSSAGVHFNKELDLKLKRKAQQVWENTYGDRDAFIKRYGKSYL